MAKVKTNRAKTLTGKAANYGFGRVIDLARAEPVMIARFVVMAIRSSANEGAGCRGDQGLSDGRSKGAKE